MRVIRSLETRAQSKWESWFPLRTILAFKSLSKDSILAQSFQPVGLPCWNPWQHQSLATVTIPDTAFLLIKQASNQKKFRYSNKLLQGLQHFFLHPVLLSQLGITFFLSVWRGGLTQISSEPWKNSSSHYSHVVFWTISGASVLCLSRWVCSLLNSSVRM